jgi:hypothetical protein
VTDFIPLERVTVKNLIGGLVISRTGMDVEVKKNISASAGNRNTFIQMVGTLG